MAIGTVTQRPTASITGRTLNIGGATWTALALR